MLSQSFVVIKSCQKSMFAIVFMTTVAALGLTACNDSSDPSSTADSTLTNSNTSSNAGSNGTDTAVDIDGDVDSNADLNASSDTNSVGMPQNASTPDGVLKIDWSKVDEGIEPVDPSSFNYPFDLDSSPVKAQASFSNITPQQAQHILTLGMVSNEPVDELLNQLGNRYQSHSFSEKDGVLRVYTAPNVEPSRFDYVISDEYARGLILPIEVMPNTQNKTD